LEEEEELIGGHRQHIDDVVDLVKQEMMLLHEVDKPGSDDAGHSPNNQNAHRQPKLDRFTVAHPRWFISWIQSWLTLRLRRMVG